MRSSSPRQGQAALEYLMILGIALLIAAPIILQVQQSSFLLRDSFQNGLVRNSLNNIEEAAALVNSQGEPAKVTFRIRLPDRLVQTNVTDNYVYVERRIGGGKTAEFYSVLDFNVSGEIPVEEGIHVMVAEAEPGYVNITAQ